MDSVRARSLPYSKLGEVPNHTLKVEIGNAVTIERL